MADNLLNYQKIIMNI